MNTVSQRLMYYTAMIICMPFFAQAASTLHIEGIVSHTQYKRDGTALNSIDGHFLLATDFSQWNVKYTDDTNNTEQETTFDGTFTYTLYANFPLANYQAAAKFLGTNNPFADEIIFTNRHYYRKADHAIMGTSRQPVSLFDSGQVAWMNLLACGLISNPPPQLLPPWSFSPDEASSYISRMDESTREKEGCAPIEFITSQQRWDATKKRSASQADRMYVPKEDFVEGRFRVVSWTNVQHKCVPLEAELVRFWFPKLQIYPGKPVRSMIRTTVTKHYFSSETISPPVLSKKTYVDDGRFKTPGATNFPIHYAVTGKTWLDKNDPRLVRYVAESRTNYLHMQEMMKKQAQKPVSNPRLTLIILTFLIAALPVVIYLLRRR